MLVSFVATAYNTEASILPNSSRTFWIVIAVVFPVSSTIPLKVVSKVALALFADFNL